MMRSFYASPEPPATTGGCQGRRTQCLGGRLRRGLLRPASSRMRRRVVRPMSMPSRSLSNSLRWVWLVPSYLVRAKRTTSATTASGVAWVACGPGGREPRRRLPVSRQHAPGVPSGDTHQRGCLIQCHVLSEQTVQNLKSCLFFLTQSRVFGLHRDTVRKMPAYSVPPGYRRESPPRRPKLEAFTGVIDAILEADGRVPRKQRHTAKRVFERLKDEYGFDGQYTIVKDYVRERGRRTQEMFVPLSHGPGHAQCDFGEAVAVIAGVECKVHYFVLDLHPQRRLLREGVSGGDHRGLSGRPRVGVRLSGRDPPEHSVRQYQTGGGEDTGLWTPEAHPGLHRVAVPLPVRGPVRSTRQVSTPSGTVCRRP